MQATSDIGTQTPTPAIDAAGPRGLRGWLLLPIFHLITTVLLSAHNLSFVIWDWEGIVALATGQIDPNYQWLLWPMLLSVVMGVGIVAFAIYLLVILFQKKGALPRLMVWFYSAMLIAMGMEFGMSFQYVEFTEAPEDVTQAGNDFVRAVIAAAIWIPYFLRSKRVKATFVN